MDDPDLFNVMYVWIRTSVPEHSAEDDYIRIHGIPEREVRKEPSPPYTHDRSHKCATVTVLIIAGRMRDYAIPLQKLFLLIF